TNSQEESVLPGINNSGVGSSSSKKNVTPTPITRNQYTEINTLANRQTPVNPLANQLTNRTKDLANLTKPLPITERKQGLNVDPNVATGIGLSAIGYLNSAKNINQMQTD